MSSLSPKSNGLNKPQSASRDSIGDFIIGDKLGEGTFSKVCQGTHKITNEKVAIKIMSKAQIKEPSDKLRIEKEINIQIGEQIKAARERAKMTQESLAERIEVSPQYVSDLERGVVGVSISTLKKICLALGVSSDQILFGSTQSNDFAPVSEKCRCLSHEQFTILCEIIEKYIRAVTLTQKD